MKQQRKTSNATVIKLAQGVEIHLLPGPDKAWLGIGAVTVGGIPLRDGRFPLLLRLDTPEGYQYDRAFLEGIERKKSGETHVTLRMVGTPGLRQEYLDEYGLPNGYSYQLAPRGGLIQAFDFLVEPQPAGLQLRRADALPVR